MLVLSDFAAHARADAVDWPEVERAFEQLGEAEPNRAVTAAVAAPDPATGRVSIRADVQSGDPIAVRVETLAGRVLAETEVEPADGRARAGRQRPPDRRRLQSVQEGRPV